MDNVQPAARIYRTTPNTPVQYVICSAVHAIRLLSKQVHPISIKS